MQNPVVPNPGRLSLSRSVLIRFPLTCFLATMTLLHSAQASPRAIHPEITVLPAGKSDETGFVQLKFNPVDLHLYLGHGSGKVFRLDPKSAGVASDYELVYTPQDHGLAEVAGMAIGTNGTIYLTGNRTEGKSNIATIVRGVLKTPGSLTREWSILAETVPYPLSGGGFNHKVNGAVLSPDNRFLFVNSGSRTDHGEISDNKGAFPGLREAALTDIILRIPTTADHLILPNDRAALRSQGTLFAEGVRNSFSLNFSPKGELFATENSADRDNPEELNWIREGRHYGFPWRMGNSDNPQRYPDYDPAKDLLLNSAYSAVKTGTYSNDPTFPAAPLAMEEPILNLGPDANKYRDPLTGRGRDAALDGVAFGTFTAHRSPLGLVFDTEQKLSPEFRGHAFVTCYTHGNLDDLRDEEGPFVDPSEDILHIDLMDRGDRYELYSDRIVEGLSSPVDSVLVGNQIFVLQYFKGTNLWAFTLPTNGVASATLKLSSAVGAEGRPQISVNAEPGSWVRVEWSDDLKNWSTGIRQRQATEGLKPVVYDDPLPVKSSGRYYRAWQQ